MKWKFILLFILATNYLLGQCPDGPSPTFWHPNQVDSFKNLYPDCRDYIFEAEIRNGQYVRPRKVTASDKIFYVIVLILTLALILIALKVISEKVRIFK